MRKHLANELPWQRFFRQTLSLLVTFYISYLFLHFVILELMPIENTIVIVAIIWAGHILLNAITIAVKKNQTFGDLFFRLQYNSLTGINASGVALPLLIRSLLTTNVLYLLVCLNVQLQFPMGALFASFCLGIFLLIFPFKRQDFQTLNLFDWISRTRAT